MLRKRLESPQNYQQYQPSLPTEKRRVRLGVLCNIVQNAWMKLMLVFYKAWETMIFMILIGKFVFNIAVQYCEKRIVFAVCKRVQKNTIWNFAIFNLFFEILSGIFF